MGWFARQAREGVTYCLPLSHVITINQRRCREEWEPHGVRDETGLKRALSRPLSGFGDHEVFRSPVAKAGALLHSLALEHPFIQANKRTAWDSAVTLLGLYGFDVDADEDDAVAMVLSVVNDHLNEAGIALWLADRILLRSP